MCRDRKWSVGSLYTKTIDEKVKIGGKMNKLKKIIKKPWPFWVGGVLLGLINIILLAISGISWQVTSGFLTWGVGILDFIGFDPMKWEYFSHFDFYYNPIIETQNIFLNQYALLNIGVIIGSLAATLMASEFKIRRIKNKKQFLMALLGGIIMGYGTRLAVGCNIGALFSGIPSFSLHAWVFGLFSMMGVSVGVIIIKKFMI